MIFGSYIAAVYAKKVPKNVMVAILIGILVYSSIRLILQALTNVVEGNVFHTHYNIFYLDFVM